MIPKSLLLAIIVGIAASGLIGIFFLNLKDSNELTYVDGPSLSVLTDKTTYRLGEPVSIRVINSGTVPLVFEDSSYGMEIRGLDTILIYSPSSTPESITLQPRQEAIFVWNQTKNNGDHVTQGIYKLYIKAITNNGTELQKTTTIEIL